MFLPLLEKQKVIKQEEKKIQSVQYCWTKIFNNNNNIGNIPKINWTDILSRNLTVCECKCGPGEYDGRSFC